MSRAAIATLLIGLLAPTAVLADDIAAPTFTMVPREKPAINEYMSKDTYVQGDPERLTVENMDSGKRINFLACPIIQDSDPTPLWLTDYKGQRYFIRAQQNLSADVHHPQLMHKVLVEGVISNEPSPVAGAKVLNPVWISVMRELDTSCDQVLPAKDGDHVQNAKRPPAAGPSSIDREARNVRRRAQLVKLDTPMATYVADPVPRETRTFTVPFEFDSDYMFAYQTVSEAALFSKNLGGGRIEVDVYRGSALLEDGGKLVERDDVTADRARNIRLILADAHIDPKLVTVKEFSQPVVPNGVDDFANRKAVLIVTPPGAAPSGGLAQR